MNNNTSDSIDVNSISVISIIISDGRGDRARGNDKSDRTSVILII